MHRTIATILGSFLWLSFATGQVAVIANKSVPVDEVTSQQLLDFYTGDVKLWENKDPVIVTDLKPEGEVKALFYEFLGKSHSRMKSIWLKKMLSGEGDPPEALKSESEVLQKVSSTPGAIGFVSEANISDDVKVLTVIPRKD